MNPKIDDLGSVGKIYFSIGRVRCVWNTESGSTWWEIGSQKSRGNSTPNTKIVLHMKKKKANLPR